MRLNYLPLLSFLWMLLVSGCQDFPKDPQKTLEKVTNHTLEVGYSENPPWVVKGETEPTGIEPQLVKAFARTLNAQVRWHNDTEQNLLEDLEKRKLHLVIAGLTDKSPWKSKVAFTRPYLTQGKEKHVLAVVMGENAFTLQLEKFLYRHEAHLKKQVQP